MQSTQSKSKTWLIKNANIVLPNQILPGNLLIESGLIANMGSFAIPESVNEVIDASGKYLLPGFIDIHNHGGQGFDFSLGLHENGQFNLDKESFKIGMRKYLQYFLQKGTTRVVPTTLAAPIDTLKASFNLLREFMDSTDNLCSMILGINLEGTFLKMAEYAGAQDPNNFYPPHKDYLEGLQNASGNLLRIVNVPPEHGDTGLEFIEYLTQMGLIVAGGHTGADACQFDQAIDKGLQLAVHFLNGPSKSSSKVFFGGGAVEAMLKSDKVSMEIIADGYHVHPAYVRDTITRKTVNNIILITDSMFVNGCQNVGNFEIGGIPGGQSENGEYLEVKNKPGTLFGSVLTPDKAFENLLNWLTVDMPGVWYRHHPALDLHEAIIKVSNMMSGNPARLLGINNLDGISGNGTGSIEVGKWADLLIVDIEQSTRFDLEVEKVFLQGKRNI